MNRVENKRALVLDPMITHTRTSRPQSISYDISEEYMTHRIILNSAYRLDDLNAESLFQPMTALKGLGWNMT